LQAVAAKKEQELADSRARTKHLYAQRSRLQASALLSEQEALWRELDGLKTLGAQDTNAMMLENDKLRVRLDRVQLQRRSLVATKYALDPSIAASHTDEGEQVYLQDVMLLRQQAKNAIAQTEVADMELNTLRSDMTYHRELVKSVRTSRDELQERYHKAVAILTALKEHVRSLQSQILLKLDGLADKLRDQDRCEVLSPRLVGGATRYKQARVVLRDCIWGNMVEAKSTWGKSSRVQRLLALEQRQQQQQLLRYAAGHADRAVADSGLLGQANTPASPFQERLALERATHPHLPDVCGRRSPRTKARHP